MGAAASVDSVDNVDSAVMLLSSGGADADVVDKLPVPLIAVSWCLFLRSMYVMLALALMMVLMVIIVSHRLNMLAIVM